jgi:hypothetical protein
MENARTENLKAAFLDCKPLLVIIEEDSERSPKVNDSGIFQKISLELGISSRVIRNIDAIRYPLNAIHLFQH